VGIALSVQAYGAQDDSPEARRSRDFLHHWWMGAWVDALATGKLAGLEIPDQTIDGLAPGDDFVGIQYYSGLVVGKGAEGAATGRLPAWKGTDYPESVRASARHNQLGWAWYPQGLAGMVDEVSETGLPIYVTENGIATEDDDERIEYTTLHLEQVHAAIRRGRDLRGYFYWSLLDNFEWNEGYRPTFGLVAVDRKTMERTPKPSLAWYGSVAKANAL
jgi:beta-glucosidase